MTTKFLYGKKVFLSKIIQGVKSPRFTDISHYGRLENAKIRDNEMSKKFIFDKDSTTISLNGHTLDPASIVGNPTLSVPTQHCYCLCLSNRKELFDIFDADICIEFETEKLLKIVELAFSTKLPGLTIEARDIKYYDPNSPPETTDPKEMVFYKPNCFSPEDEFRIAIFYPANKSGFRTESGLTIPWYVKDDSLHLEFLHTEPRFIQQCIVGVYELPA